jgi:GNAT superfamily N-acetyltransferase
MDTYVINVTLLTGSSILGIIPELATLRIKVFREYPYLYDGSSKYEEKYLQRYSESEQCIVVVVHDGDTIVGASTGMPLADEAPEVVNPIRDAGYNINEWFYLAESILLPEYRGRRFGHRFFDDRLIHAHDYGYKMACFCAVVRPDDHPRRPANYSPLIPLWQRHGFKKMTGLKTSFSWKDIGETQESSKPMEYWVREL